jgi:hypothetical protein
MHDLVAVSEMLSDLDIIPSKLIEEKIINKQNKVRKNMKGRIDD